MSPKTRSKPGSGDSWHYDCTTPDVVVWWIFVDVDFTLTLLLVPYSPEWQCHPKQGLSQGAVTVDTMTARYVRSPGSHCLVQLAVLHSPEWQGHPKQGLRQGAVTVGTMTVQHLGSPMSGEARNQTRHTRSVSISYSWCVQQICRQMSCCSFYSKYLVAESTDSSKFYLIDIQLIDRRHCSKTSCNAI